MSMIDALILEMKLLAKSKAFYILVLFLFLNAAFSMYSQYSYLIGIKKDMIKFKEDVIAQSRGLPEEQLEKLVEDVTESKKNYIKKDLVPYQKSTGPNNILLIVSELGKLLMQILGAVVIGTEFQNRTARLKAAHYGWLKSVSSKIILLILISAFLVGISYLAGIYWGKFLSNVIKSNFDFAKDIPEANLPSSDAIRMFSVFSGFILFSLLGIMATLVFRNSLAGVVSVAALIIFDWYVLRHFIKIWWILPNRIYTRLLNLHFASFDSGIGLVSVTASPYKVSALNCWIGISAWLVILLLLSLAIAKYQEL